MADRVSVPEAVRRTGVPGEQIALAVLHRTITETPDDHGFPLVLLDEVRRLSREELGGNGSVSMPPSPAS